LQATFYPNLVIAVTKYKHLPARIRILNLRFRRALLKSIKPPKDLISHSLLIIVKKVKQKIKFSPQLKKGKQPSLWAKKLDFYQLRCAAVFTLPLRQMVNNRTF
jgi:hypothetical protein